MSVHIQNGVMVDERGYRVRPEIGNPEHIEAVREYEALLMSAEVDDISASCTVRVAAYTNCECGASLCIDAEDDDVDPDDGFDSNQVNDLLDGETVTCDECMKSYKLKKHKGKLRLVKQVAAQQPIILKGGGDE